MIATRSLFVLFGLLGSSGVALAQEAVPCNPPCVAGQMCTTSGQCVAVTMVPPPPPSQPPPPPPEEHEKAGAHTHDGFYFRLGLGIGYFSGSLDTNPSTSITGAHLALDLAFGGTPVPGLVIGGGIYGSGGKSKWDSNGTSFDLDTTTFSTVGPFVDWYPNPKDGWHVTGMLGFSRFQFERNNSFTATSNVGGAAMIGGGYEFWIGREWSLGVIGRLQLAAAQLDAVTSNGVALTSSSQRVSTIEPAILLGVTYH
jgi:hypothetical protein